MGKMNNVKLRTTKRLLSGHLWVFSNELVGSPKGFSPGEAVEVHGPKDEFLGVGYINPQSLIAVRILTREKEEIGRDFFRRRIVDALHMRERFLKNKNAYRAVYSEGDFLPGLIVDKFDGALSVQFLTAGIEAQKDTLISILDEVFDPGLIVLRNDSRVRTLEGLPLYKEVVKGTLESLPLINEDGVRFEANPYEGQKTGFFLDQAENRAALKELINGGEGLDLFSYSGAWAMHLASKGARVACVDESERALNEGRRNAELNGLSERIHFLKSDVFLFLEKELAQKKGAYDFIVLDPPAFVKSARKLKEAVKAYRTLNARCMGLLRRGGLLATSSCSYHLSREMFLDMLRAAAKDAGRGARLLALRSQGRDHPVLLSMPETEYLKCAFLIID